MNMTLTTSMNETKEQNKPGFMGVYNGELFKAMRQRSNWIMFFGIMGLTLMFWLAFLLLSHNQQRILVNPAHYFYTNLTGTFNVFPRAFGGFFFIALTVRMIGLDYQQGTIRIILARGVDRMVLLAAKLAAALTLSTAALAIFIAETIGVGMIISGVIANTTSIYSSLDATFWSGIWAYVVTLIVNMVVSILIGACVAVIGRSLAFGLGVGLIFFPADNIGSTILFIIYRVTGNDFWIKFSAYLLGPNLNLLPSLYAPTLTLQGELSKPTTLGATPLVNYDLTHVWFVIGIYAVAALVTMFVLTRQRDVLE